MISLSDKVENIVAKVTKRAMMALYRSTGSYVKPLHVIGFFHVFEVVNIRRGPKNGLTSECEAKT